MSNPLRCFEPYGIYISIIFYRGDVQYPRWIFSIDSIEKSFGSSEPFEDYDECEKEALIKASEIVQYKM